MEGFDHVEPGVEGFVTQLQASVDNADEVERSIVDLFTELAGNLR